MAQESFNFVNNFWACFKLNNRQSRLDKFLIQLLAAEHVLAVNSDKICCV